MAALLIQPPHTFCTAHFFPWIVFLLPAVFQYRLCHHLLPNASSLLAPQLVTPGPILQNCPLWELLHRSASNKNRNPCQFCISWIISYVSRFSVVLDCLLLWLFTVLRVFSNKPFRLFYYEECCKSKALMHFFFFFLITELDKETSASKPLWASSKDTGSRSFQVQYLLLIHSPYTKMLIFAKCHRYQNLTWFWQAIAHHLCFTLSK